MMRRFSPGILLLILVGATWADDMTFGPDVAHGVVNGVTWLGPEDVYVSPYYATDGTPNSLVGTDPIRIYCLDWNHNINFGQTWSADIFAIDSVPGNAVNAGLLYYDQDATRAYLLDYDSTSGLVGFTEFDPTQADMYARYLEAAWLFNQMRLLLAPGSPGDPTLKDVEQRELNVAAWTLFLEVYPTIDKTQTDAAAYAAAFAGDINRDPAFAHDVYNYVKCAEAHVKGGQCVLPGGDGVPQDVPIREGDIFLLPPNIPHSPQRPAGTRRE